ncbi:hypothetical protein O181_024959 [Austropuccinia psidii MF-1]|uniref:Uncharacterized protein n=1 Tax=Austropuccinia psidii MF-1 TaxID=1389203 RepID=A0A9Q3H063_9BASI|nr:hypothetical protein [Austropuccinia psidii MF-1]
MEPDYKKEDQVLVSTLNCNHLKGPKKMRDSFVGPFTIIKLIGKKAVEVKLAEEFPKKYPVFPNQRYKANKPNTAFCLKHAYVQESCTWHNLAIFNNNHIK